MFAFAVLDFANDLRFPARDRAGEKPFYYCETADEFLFGSEIEINMTDEYEASST